MDTIIGRKNEKKKLARILDSGEAEFLAIYGRRRVGKTYTIREFFKNTGLYFEVTGQKDATLNEQLDNFHKTLHETFKPALPIQKPESWKEAFSFLTILLKLQPSEQKIILFLDELPWLATKRSGLLQALDYEWNSVWSRMNNLKLIVCGSAASWILEKLIHAKGGLYNRLTNTIHLKPFSIGESRLYLEQKGVQFTPVQLLELYMVMGGIPYYLRHVEKGQSATQIINTLCFQKDGLLFSEFNRLFKSLFDQSEIHYKIIREVAKKRNGISRDDLLQATGYTSGGTFKKRLNELKESGFIDEFIPYGRKKKAFIIKIIDEYTLFFLTWIEPLQSTSSTISYNPNYWLNVSTGSSYRSWSGYAFEAVCLKHIDRILAALELENLATGIGRWKFIPPKKSKEAGAEIDLIIDRVDNCINICEIKFSNKEYQIDKNYAKILANKIKVFQDKTKTQKQIFLTMITTYGVKQNIWSEDLVDSTVDLKELLCVI